MLTIWFLFFLLSCLVGLAVVIWLWTVEDYAAQTAIPWSSSERLDFDEYPITPGLDWTGLA